MFKNLPKLISIIILNLLINTVRGQSCLSCSSNIPINSGLIWCHNFNGHYNDLTNNGYDGTSYQTNFISDRFGKPNSAIDFDGINSYISINKLIPSSLPSFSFSLWIKPGTNSGLGFILWEGDGACGNDIFLVITNNDLKPGANKNASLNGLTNNNEVYAAPTSIINNWSHVVWVIEPTSSKIYLNGVLQKTTVTSCNGSGYNYPFSYGSKYDGGNMACGVGRQFYYKGAIDDVRFYNRAITSTEVSQLFNLESSPEISILPIQDKSICLGDSIKLNPTISNATSFVWEPSTGVSNINSQNPFFFPTDTTTYILKATSGNCTQRDTVKVNVVKIEISLGPDLIVCKGDSVQIQGTGKGASIYNWQPSNGVSNPQILNPWIKKPGQTYYVTAQNGNCSSIDTISIQFKSISIKLEDTVTYCQGDTIQLTPLTQNLSGGATFYWTGSSEISDPTIINPKIYPSTSTTYKIEINDGNCKLQDSIHYQKIVPQVQINDSISACKSDTIKVFPNTNCQKFKWKPNLNIENDTLKNQLFFPNSSGWYALEGKVGTCKAIDSIFIKRSSLILSSTDSVIKCPGDTFTLGAIVQNTSHVYWSPGTFLLDSTKLNTLAFPPSNTNFTLFVFGEDGCVEKLIFKSIIQNPTIIKSSDKTICKGDSTQISVFSTGPITWINPYRLNPISSKNPMVYPEIDTFYLFSVTEGSCIVKDTIKIYTKSKPIVDAGKDLSHCFEETVGITANISNATNYHWLDNKPYWQDSMDLNPRISVIGTKKFVLFASNSGCENFDTINIMGYPKVFASFNLDPSTGIPPFSINTSNTSIGGNRYTWSTESKISFSDSTAFEPILIVNDSGVQIVTLLVRNEIGCWDTASQIIRSIIEPYLEIPNVFTPNFDSINDVFKVIFNIEAYEYLELKIYSRWGELLFESRFPNGNWWDGTYKGNPCPDGVYFYLVEAKPKLRNKRNLHGTVTLLR